MASDSRLTGLPGHVDYCQKLFPLSRDDAAIGFCGHTVIAYPFVLQVANYVNHYARARARALDIRDMRGRLLDILNDFRASHIDPIDFELDNLQTEFIFAGWSWRHEEFEISLFHYDRSIRSYTFRPSTVWRGQDDSGSGRGKRIAIAGDYVDVFRHRLITKLRATDKLTKGGFDMEPFEILAEMLRDQTYTDRAHPNKGLIGGSPQVLKVYRFSSVLPFGVRWKNPVEKVHLLGRPLLHYEVTTLPIIDPTDMSISYPLQSVSKTPNPSIVLDDSKTDLCENS